MPNIQTITNASGTFPYVPNTRTLTINGISYDLSADRSWTISTSGTGTVTSVGLSASMPTGLVATISGSPITTNGTLGLTVSMQSGYAIPTTAKQTQWDSAYNFTNTFPTGSALQLLRVNSAGTALEFFTASYLSSTGTTNYIPKFTSATSLGDSIIEEISGAITVRGNIQTYKQQAGAGQTNIFIDNRDTAAAQTSSTILSTQHLGSGQARTLIYAASNTAGNKNRGELGILTENGSNYIANIGTQITGVDNAFSLYSTSFVENIRLNTGGTSWLNGGNVGINTNSPTEILSVSGNTHIAGVGNSLYFDTTGVAKSIRQYVTNNFEFTTYNDRGNTSKFVLGNAFISLGTNPITHFYINTSNGNTGIGTTIPDSILQVVSSNPKGVIFGSSAGAVGTTQITTTAGSSPVSSRLMFGTDGTGWQFRIAQNLAGTITDLVTVQTGGNVGINQLNPTEKLDVVGNIKLSGNVLGGTWQGNTITPAYGGTGATSLTGVVIGNGTSAMTAVSGTSGQILRRNIANNAYEFYTPNFIDTSRTITINGVTFDLSANRTWNVGTVTSVGVTMPTGFSVASSPITTSGTIGISFAAGYSLPTNAKQTEWDAAYNDKINSASVTGTTTKTLTLNQQDGGTITASWTDINTDAVTSVFGRTGAVVSANGDYTTAQVTESGNLYYTDARARAAISLTTTGTSGAATYTSGVLNIPNYTLSGLGGVSGSGTINTIAKFTGSGSIGNSQIIDDGTNVGIGVTPSFKLHVNGTLGVVSAATFSSTAQAAGFITSGGTGYAVINSAANIVTALRPTGGGTNVMSTNSNGLHIALGTQAAGDLILASNNTERIRISQNGFFSHINGTNPTSNITDSYIQYSNDVTAGNAAPHFRTENGAVVKLYQETSSVAGANFVAGFGTSLSEFDQYDGYTIAQVVKALRNLGILQ